MAAQLNYVVNTNLRVTILEFLGSQACCWAVSKILNGVLVLLLLPEGQVLLEKLDDGLGIPEGFLVDVVNFLESIR